MNKVLMLLIVFFVNPTFANQHVTYLVDFESPCTAAEQPLPATPADPITNSDNENNAEDTIQNNNNTPDDTNTTGDPETEQPSTDVGIPPTQGS